MARIRSGTLEQIVISTVVPIFNEEDTLPELRRRLAAALDQTGEAWEIVFVDDGSSDGSVSLVSQYHREDPRIKLVRLSRNFGHQPSLTAGIHHATGSCVVLIDGDLQDPPEIIPEMVSAWRSGFDVVAAERRSRKDKGVRGLGFRLFYPVLRRVADLDVTEAGIFGLMDRKVVEHFNRLPERNRFIPGLRSWLGFKQTAVLYDRQQRAAGEPKQTLTKLLKYAADGMVSFSQKPLRIATWMGLLISALTFVATLGYIAAYFLQAEPPPRGFTTILLSVLFLGGVQLICVGILGEYIGRIYEELKQRPLYVVQERLGLGLPLDK